jgi:hypothetical protein
MFSYLSNPTAGQPGAPAGTYNARLLQQQPSILSGMGNNFGNMFSSVGNGIGNIFGYPPQEPNQQQVQAQKEEQQQLLTRQSTKAMVSSILTVALSVSSFVFVLFLILVFIHYTMTPIFSFSPAEPGIITIPTSSDRQIAFTTSPAPSDLSANFVGVPACSYTISADVYLSGDFMTSAFPRMILYRSVKNGGVTINSQRGGADLGARTVDGYITQIPDSNLVVWLDPIKNDLFVSVVTNGQTGVAAGSSAAAGSVPAASTAPNRIETTKAIENVPMKKVFRLTIVFTQQFLEVYINGNLEQSLAFIGAPLTSATNANFYGPVSAVGPNIRLANLTFWPRTLTAREVRTYGSPMVNETFFYKIIK